MTKRAARQSQGPAPSLGNHDREEGGAAWLEEGGGARLSVDEGERRVRSMVARGGGGRGARKLEEEEGDDCSEGWIREKGARLEEGGQHGRRRDRSVVAGGGGREGRGGRRWKRKGSASAGGRHSWPTSVRESPRSRSRSLRVGV